MRPRAWTTGPSVGGDGVSAVFALPGIAET